MFEETIIHANSKRKHIKIIDRKNNRVKYVIEYPDGSRKDCVMPHSGNEGESAWQPLDQSFCVKVVWIGCQSAEDLYRRVDRPERVYARKPAGKDRVQWCTTSKWQGRYESDCPLRNGLLVHVVDKAGHFLFTEQICETDYCASTSEKKGPFSYEESKKWADWVQKTYHLISHEEWRYWLLSMKDQFDNTDYDDTWLYNDTEQQEKIREIENIPLLGETSTLIRRKQRHKIAGCEWYEFILVSGDESVPIEICGYEKVRG